MSDFSDFVAAPAPAAKPAAPAALDFDSFTAKPKVPAIEQPYPEAGPIRAAMPPKPGFKEEFWDTLTNESLRDILGRGLIPNLAKGAGRSFEEAQKRKMAPELREGLGLSGTAPAGYRWATPEEMKGGSQTMIRETDQAIGDVLRQAKEHLVKHPGATTAEFLKGIVADPELLLPVFGSAASATKLSSFVARLGKLGAAGERAVRTAATAGELAIKGGAISGAVTAADQFAKGVYDSAELAANTLIGGAMFSAVGAVRGMFSKAELQSGRIPKNKAEDLLAAWAEKDPNIAKAVDAGELTVADVQRKAFLELEADKILNARAKADALMQKGASIKEVEAAIRKDKLVGEELAKIRARREDVAASRLGQVLQGEVLDPKAKPRLPPPKPEVIDMPRAEAAADAGLPRRISAPKSQRGAVDVTIFDDMIGPNAKDSALGPLVAAAPYTLKTLERLPKNRTEFPVELIRNELRRQDVTDAERNVLSTAIAGAQDGKISAVNLMRGVQAATGDWQLSAKQTDAYANYGLEGIDRLVPDDFAEFDQADAARSTIRQNPVSGLYDILSPRGELMDSIPLLEGLTPAEALTNWRSQAIVDLKGPEATTTLYRLPDHMKMSDANHFRDDQLFGWTRSFNEGGVRHVVEIQSDLAQHAKGGVKPEEVPRLMEVHGQIGEQVRTLEAMRDRALQPGRNAEVLEDLRGMTQFREALRRGENHAGALLAREIRALRLRQEEISNQLASTAVDSQLAPVLKNWPKRLIREELAQAAKELEIPRGLAEDLAVSDPQRLAELQARPPVVRFATADTVAKVEGWPKHDPVAQAMRNYEAFNRQYRNLKEQADRYEEVMKSGETTRFGRDGGERYVFSPEELAAQKENLARDREALKTLETKTEAAYQEWQELEKAGTQARFSPEHQSIYDRYSRDITKFLKQLGGTEVTDAQGHTWIEVPVPKRGPVQMFGRASDDLLIPAGAVVGGAALGAFLDREPGDSGAGGAVLGALAGLAVGTGAGRAGIRAGATAADKGLGLISTRIRNISEPLLHRAREFERASLEKTHQRIGQADTFLQGLEKLKNPELERAIKTNDTARINALMPAELRGDWAKVRATLDEVGRELQKYDRLSNLREGYFPRIVKDREGLLKALGVQERSRVEQLLKREELASIKAGNGPLDAAQQSAVINKYLQERVGGDRPGFTKQRKLSEITEALDPYYASNTEALHSYLSAATGAIERSKFFGRDLVTQEIDGRQVVDLNSSIGRVVARELEAKRINPAQADELAEMLRARFESRAPNPLVQDVKNLANAGLLGNVLSAGTQLGDIGTAIYMQGLRPSLEAVARTLSRNNKVSMKDFGLVDHISEEFVSTRSTAKALNTIFKLSGFSSVDALGKNTLLNAALSRFQRLAQSNKGELEIARKYAQMFGDDYPKLVEELRSKTIGEQTRALLFSELSDAQPITKLEVPQKYLEMPNGRILYMLKTFMLKQADIVRRDAYNEVINGYKNGKPAQVARGIGNLGKFALALGISGATTQTVKDWLLGREVDFDSADVALNFLKTFALSEYTLDKIKQGKPLEAVRDAALPPYKMFDELAQMDEDAVRYIPLVGPILYARSDKAQAKVEKGKEPTAEQRLARERLRKAQERLKREQRLESR